MSRRRFDDMDCSVAQALEVLGDWWTLLIVRECFSGSRRFGDFEAHLPIAKNVLSARLQRLVAHDILERRDVGRRGRRFEYRLTEKGRDLYPLLTALRQWADRWIYGPGREPLLVVDRRTGRPIPPLRPTGDDGEPLDLRQLRAVPGPGAGEAIRARFRREEAPRGRS